MMYCMDEIATGYRPGCNSIDDIMDSIGQNPQYIRYIEQVIYFNPTMCPTNSTTGN
mgnify:CR=1 FL=1